MRIHGKWILINSVTLLTKKIVILAANANLVNVEFNFYKM